MLSSPDLCFPVSLPVKKIELSECLAFEYFYFQLVETSYTKGTIIHVHIRSFSQKAVFKNDFLTGPLTSDEPIYSEGE